MSRYRKIDTRMWNDAKFRALSDDGKLVFVLFLTHPSMTALGALPASVPGLAHGLKWSEERFRKGFDELLWNGMAKADEDAGLVCLPNFLRYNPPENPNVVKAWAGSVDMLPECELKTETMARAYASLETRPKSFAEAFLKQFGKPLADGIGNRMPNQEPEPEPEQEPEPEPEPQKESGSGQESLALTHVHTRETTHPDWSETDWSLFDSTLAFQLDRGDSELQARKFAVDKVESARQFRLGRAA
jgi:hypothetical protein